MKKTLIILLGVIVIAGVLIGTLRWNAQQRIALLIETHQIPPPSTKGLHPELAQRILEQNKRAMEGPERLETRETLSRLYHANGYLNHAWQTYRILIEIDEDNPLWAHRLATIISGYGQLSDSLALYRKAIDLDPKYTPSRIHLGDTLLKLNRYEEATDVFQSILDDEPTNSYALFGQARISIAQDDIDRAKGHLESARRANKLIGGDLLADIYETLGETSKARALLHETIWSSHVDIADPWVDDIVSDCYDSFEVSMAAGIAGRAGNTTKAIRLLQRSITLDPLDHNAHNHLAKLYLRQGDLSLAKKSFENCTKVAPSFAEGWSGLISIELQSGINAKAINLIDQGLAICPDSYVITNYKGDSLIALNRTKEAIPYFEKTIQVVPENAVGYNYLARAYIKLGENSKAFEQLSKALKAEPSNPTAIKLMTLFYISAGDRAQAQNLINKAIASPRISEEVINTMQETFKERFE